MIRRDWSLLQPLLGNVLQCKGYQQCLKEGRERAVSRRGWKVVHVLITRKQLDEVTSSTAPCEAFRATVIWKTTGSHQTDQASLALHHPNAVTGFHRCFRTGRSSNCHRRATVYRSSCVLDLDESAICDQSRDTFRDGARRIKPASDDAVATNSYPVPMQHQYLKDFSVLSARPCDLQWQSRSATNCSSTSSTACHPASINA